MPIITLGVVNSKDNGGPAFISDSALPGVAIGVPVDGSLDNTVLQDSSDVTYYQILGSAGADTSQGFQSERLVDLVPFEAAVESVTFNFRARLGPGAVFPPCTAFPNTEIWGVLSPPGPGYFYGYQSLTTSFANYSFPLTVSPNGVAWSSLGAVGFGFMEALRMGMRGRTSCPDVFGERIEVDWSEASLTIDLNMDPTVETLSAGSIGVGAAELRGQISPNQGLTGLGTVCTLFPVSWQFMFGDDPTDLEEVGTESGYILGEETVPVGFNISNLDPLKTYFYRLKAFCGGEIFLGDVRSFKTLGADPSLGAY